MDGTFRAQQLRRRSVFRAEMETLSGRGSEEDIGTFGSDLTGFTEKKNTSFEGASEGLKVVLHC